MKFINKKALIALFALGAISISNANQVPFKITTYKSSFNNVAIQNIELTSLENDLVIYNIIVNRGYCAKKKYDFPPTLNLNQRTGLSRPIGIIDSNNTGQIPSDGFCSEVLEVEVNTNKGNYIVTPPFN